MNYQPTSNLGSLASIPQCNAFVAPLVPSSSFIVVFNGILDQSCVDVCRSSPGFMSLSVLIYERGGEGWYGAYYSLQVSCASMAGLYAPNRILV